MLSNSKVKHGSVEVGLEFLGRVMSRGEGRASLNRREVRVCKIRRATPQLGENTRKGVQDLTGGGPGRQGFHPVKGRKYGLKVRKLSCQESVQESLFVGILLCPLRKRLIPCLTGVPRPLS